MNCKKCKIEIFKNKRVRGMCLRCYNRWLYANSESYRNCQKRVHKEKLKKYSDDFEYRKNVLDTNRKYKHNFLTTKNFNVHVDGICPVCGQEGYIRVSCKLNSRSNTYSDFGLSFEHNPHQNILFGYCKKTCYVSVKKFPEYKGLVEELKEDLRSENNE
jgi:hypothetical protein